MIENGWVYGIYYIPKMRFIYIGITTIGVNTRKNQHLHYLRKNDHYNPKLQKVFNNSKESDFKFVTLFSKTEIIEKTLGDLEVYYISYYNTYNDNDEFACNKTKGGLGFPNKLSQDSINKMIETKNRMYEQGLIQTTDGEINGMHILKEHEVLEIIDLLKSKKYTHKEIAEIYNVSRSNIGLIANGERWSYLKEVQEYANNNKKKTPTVVPQKDLVKIKYYKEIMKLSNNKISKLTGYNYELIRKLPTRQKYKEIKLEEFIDEINKAI